MQQELYISDELADLSDEQPIALNLQVNDLADLQDRQSTYSQTIKLPKTATNKRLLGYSDSDAFTQDQPYQKPVAKYVVDGSEVVPYGSIIQQTVSDFFECLLTCGLTGINDLLSITDIDSNGIPEIRDATLLDLDYSDIANFDATLANVVASQSGTGVLWPVIDYGGTLDNSSVIPVSYLRPGIYIYQIINRIQKFLGYTFMGSILSDSQYLTDFIPFSATILYDFEGTDWRTTGLAISVAKNVPNFTIKEFLKDFMQRYFLTPVVDNYAKTLTFRSFDDLYKNKSIAKDWTEKFIDDARTDDFALANYAQVNYLYWKADEKFLINGDGVISISNTTLPLSVVMVTSIFAASNNVTALANQIIASIKKYPISPLPSTGTVPTIDTEVRIVNIRPAAGSGYNFTDGDAATFSDVALIGLFQAADGIGYQSQLKKYGQGLINLLTPKCRVITRYVSLDASDLYNFDFFIPIYDSREAKYYYVNKIVDYIPGQKTKIQLIRLGDPAPTV